MDESIYNLIPQPVPEPTKQTRYHSKHNPEAKPTFSTFGLAGTSRPGVDNVSGNKVGEEPLGAGSHTFKKSHATFGTVNNAKKPTDILAKGTGKGGGAVPLGPDVAPFKYEDKTKPPVPKKVECEEQYETIRQAHETKNFITTNAVNNILSKPKKEAEPVNWTKKPNFGKVPPYLDKIKKEISDEYEYIRSMQQADEGGPSGMRQLEEGERLELIDQLKAKWDDVNATYQRSSVLSLASLDTIGKVKRCARLSHPRAQRPRAPHACCTEARTHTCTHPHAPARAHAQTRAPPRRALASTRLGLPPPRAE
uniref:Enkurin domain-containing protein n=2 Tax=Chrysotila carterae TaxID=13221 RepID=A0A7S4BZ51_CHRCT